jgi:hypothetical protein
MTGQMTGQITGQITDRKKMKARSLERAFKTPAASYSPTGLRLQYHWPWRA